MGWCILTIPNGIDGEIVCQIITITRDYDKRIQNTMPWRIRIIQWWSLEETLEPQNTDTTKEDTPVEGGTGILGLWRSTWKQTSLQTVHEYVQSQHQHQLDYSHERTDQDGSSFVDLMTDITTNDDGNQQRQQSLSPCHRIARVGNLSNSSIESTNNNAEGTVSSDEMKDLHWKTFFLK